MSHTLIPISLTAADPTYDEDFNSLSNTAGSTTNELVLPGWELIEELGGALDNDRYAVGTGSSNSGDAYSFGSAGSTDRALGGLQSGSLNPTFGTAFVNDTGGTITSITITYTGEQWRIGNTAAARDDRLDFQYSTNATAVNNGTWTNVNELDFTNVVKTAAVAGALDGNNAANRTTITYTITGLSIPAGTTFWIRWTDLNASGADDGLAIDNLSLTAAFTPPNPNGTLAIADQTVVEGNSGDTPITFTVTRSGGTTGDVSATWTATFNTANAADFNATQTFSGTVDFADGETSKTITLNVAGDLAVEATETFTVTLSSPQGGADLGDASATGTITNDDTGPTPIHVIQGASHTSPIVGATVTTSGIVTAVDSNGYYLQDAAGDGNDATSDGIFVFTSGAPTVVVGGTPQPIQIGDNLTVTGTVTEFQANSASLTVTEITGSTAVRNSQGNSLPAAVVIGTGGRTPPTENYEDDGFTSFNPATDALDFYESMEGMRVTIDAPLVVANTNSFGETWTVASGGAGATGINDRDGITISEGDFNPERIQIDDDANLGPAYDPDHSQGDVLDDVTGILNYAFSSYEVLVTGAVTVTTDVTLVQETTALDGDSTHLTVATYNVENLDPTDPQSKFDAIAAQIVDNLGAPDIIGVQEIQDADGAGTGTNYSGQATADQLIAAIVAAGGPTYQYVEIAPTSNSTTNGEPNGNIRNGFLYNPARVTYVPGSEELILGAVASGARYPLAVDFLFNGETVTVINNHFTSRGGSDPLMGDNQPPNNAGDSARLTQAQAVRAYIDARAASDPELNIVTLGDFNSYYFEAPLQALQAGGAQNNLFLLLPEEERYSYMFEGNLQPFDNILVSPNLSLTSQFDAVHLNAEQPTGAARPTDHDPSLASILISANDTISGTSGNDTRSSGPGNDIFRLEGGGTDTASGGEGNDAFLFGATLDATDNVDGGGGVKDQLGIQGDYSGLTLGAGNLVNIETLVFLSGTDTRFGHPGGAEYDYVITTVDENVADGATLNVNFNGLVAGEDVTFDGSDESDGAFMFFAGQGDDSLTGGDGNDAFYFGVDGSGTGAFTAADSVDGGDGALDQLGLRGNYSVVFDSTTMTNIETLVLLSGHDTTYGPPAPDYGYDITTHDDNVGENEQLSVNAAQLRPGEELVFDGSEETDGYFRILSGQCNDTLIGGDNADFLWGNLGFDQMTGGGGSDTFYYRSAAESTGLFADYLADFDYEFDVIDMQGTHDNYEAIYGGYLDSSTFDGDLAAALDASLQPGDAVFFVPDDGDQAGRTYLVVDANGVAGYQVGEDYVFEMGNPPPPGPIFTDFIV